MLTHLCTSRRNLGSRAFFAAALFTIFLIVVTVLPHQHTRSDFAGRASGAVVLEASSASCALCDWLSTPHLPAATIAPVVQIPVIAWRLPTLPVVVCAPGFAVPSDSPQRGPPTFSLG